MLHIPRARGKLIRLHNREHQAHLRKEHRCNLCSETFLYCLVLHVANRRIPYRGPPVECYTTRVEKVLGEDVRLEGLRAPVLRTF